MMLKVLGEAPDYTPYLFGILSAIVGGGIAWGASVWAQRRVRADEQARWRRDEVYRLVTDQFVTIMRVIGRGSKLTQEERQEFTKVIAELAVRTALFATPEYDRAANGLTAHAVHALKPDAKTPALPYRSAVAMFTIEGRKMLGLPEATFDLLKDTPATEEPVPPPA